LAAALALPEGPRGLPLADAPVYVDGDDPEADVVVAARSPLSRWTFTFAAAPDRSPGFALAQLERGRALVLMIAALAALFAFYLSRRIGAPLAAMTEVLRRFTAGEVDARVVVDSRDEIGALADKINEMASQVGGFLHSLEEQAVRLRSEIAERTEQELRLQALNEELSEARDQALAANRAKSAFLARMSHELRTPLNAIIGYSELLMEVAEEEGLDQIGSDADAISRSARHLLELINDVLDLSKIEAGRMEVVIEEFDAAEMLRDIVTVALPLVERQQNQLEVAIEVEPAKMRSDRTKVRQCVLNLVSNAAKFTEHGRISITLRAEELGALPVLVFEVADTGIGIPAESLDKLFKTFVQVDSPLARKQTGTGLGLAITRRLCRKLGGDIKVRSVVGEGTAFTIRLPQRYHRSTSSTTWGQSESNALADESGASLR
ncbi:MAG: HAMP domain-containing protein, partial [Myxococcales bacterium]|nr:HAMP domain-containing protein [Myxococcales bacterium]